MADKRQLNDEEKKRVLEKYGRRCFVDGEPIADEEPIEFHHIKPFSRGGPTNLNNIAPVCKKHHLTIGTMSLQEYRDKLELEKFFEGDPKYLDDVIQSKKGHCGAEFKYEIRDNLIKMYFKDAQPEYPFYECPTTGWKYFYATLPVEYIANDKELQPRALRQPSMWNLYRHFQMNTQLAPSICRIDDNGKLFYLTDSIKQRRKYGPATQKLSAKYI